jgi:hypothetical protein
MGARGRTSILREAMKSLLQQHKDKGIEFCLIEQRFGAVDRRRLCKLLDNLRLCGEAHCVRSAPGGTATWYPGSDDPDRAPATLSPADWRRIQLARQSDKANPIVFHGQRLPGGRCASVWEYARRHQEQRT